MFGRSLTLFQVFGIKIKVNIGWALIAAFIAWSLAQGVFPQLYSGLDASAYWWMALAAVFGLAVSIVLHELSHSLVARAFGVPLQGITLFAFGGVAELEEEPPTPTAEFLMAIAGPAMSVALALGFGGLESAAGSAEARPAVEGVFGYLSLLNFVLAAFNMVPAFPLDGGRALRALVWAVRGDYRAATRLAARIGGGFGVVLMIAGAVLAVAGAFAHGLWWILIGLFIRGAAQSADFQEEAAHQLHGRSVRDVMTTDPDVVTPDLTLRRFVDEHLYRKHHDVFPVIEDGRPVAVIGLRQLKGASPDLWDEVTVGQVATPISEANTVEASADSLEALQKMQRSRQSRLLVLDGGRLAGVLALKDMLELITLRHELEGS
jgi:Zn-dependent protease/CBS domain-containing protein